MTFTTKIIIAQVIGIVLAAVGVLSWWLAAVPAMLYAALIAFGFWAIPVDYPRRY